MRMSAILKNQSVVGRTVWRTARSVWIAEADSVRRLCETIAPRVLAQCVEAIARCEGRVLTAGCGTSAAAARKIAHSLCCIERPALFLAPGDALHGGLGLAQRGDVAVLISKGGNTREIVSLLEPLKAKGVTIIGVTENPDSDVGQGADIVLKVKVEREPDPFNMLATASTLSVIAVFDAICIALMKVTGYSRSQFAVIHPGGAVGERLIEDRPSAKPAKTPRHK